MVPVAFPYDDFVTELDDRLRTIMLSDLEHRGELDSDAKYIQLLDSQWWTYFRSRFEARNKPLMQIWDVQELIASMQKQVGISEGGRPCGDGFIHFRMRHHDWFLLEKKNEPDYQGLWITRTPTTQTSLGLMVTDHTPEMLSLLDNRRSAIDASFARMKTEICRDHMVHRIVDIALEHDSLCLVP